MNPILKKIEKVQEKTNLPPLEIGSTIKVVIKFDDEGKERLQSFTGLLIALKNSGIRKTMVLRRVSGNYALERIFFVHSPLVTSIEVIKKGQVKRAKLYYLRKKIGKSAKIKEKI